MFCALVVPATLVAAAQGIRLFRRSRALQRQLLPALEVVSADLEELEERVDAASAGADLLDARVAALSRSLERLGVLNWALADPRETVARLRALIPRK